jgi:hypothetical protein
MGWVRIDDNAPHHRKMLTAGPAACWLWVCGLAYCQRMICDGFIPNEALPMLGVGNWKKPAGFLVSSGLWHKVEGGYQIHDYLDWNATKDEREAQMERKRQQTLDRVQRHRSKRYTEDSNAPVTRVTKSDVTHSPLHSSPTPLHSTPTPTASRASAPLVMSPLQYERLSEKNAFVGARLRIPHVLHGELRNKLGGDNPETRLQAWYSTLDEEAERTREPIPDVFAWVRPKFVELAQSASNDAVKAAFLKATGGSRGQ